MGVVVAEGSRHHLRQPRSSSEPPLPTTHTPVQALEPTWNSATRCCVMCERIGAIYMFAWLGYRAPPGLRNL